jgi:hypothetical protein
MALSEFRGMAGHYIFSLNKNSPTTYPGIAYNVRIASFTSFAP